LLIKRIRELEGELERVRGRLRTELGERSTAEARAAKAAHKRCRESLERQRFEHERRMTELEERLTAECQEELDARIAECDSLEARFSEDVRRAELQVEEVRQHLLVAYEQIQEFGREYEGQGSRFTSTRRSFLGRLYDRWLDAGYAAANTSRDLGATVSTAYRRAKRRLLGWW